MLFQGVRMLGRRSVQGYAAVGLTGAFLGDRTTASVAQCDSGKVNIPGLDSLPSQLQELAPAGGAISAGSILGLCTGFALKKIATSAAIIVGGIFAFQQGLAYMDYIKINWDKVEKDLSGLLDLNKDGKIDQKDLGVGYETLLKVMQHNTAGLSGGFAAGFLLGMKKG
eukprot:TRINITY_DN14267_c0_g1_i1.p1 TRINITY_DN14267_c0_g1~~TRINITY_DN14267_c0_g1_i1.p1  ORF type:complete len:168 (-),score=38.55 TRINITY_DN14267_c0_g1_i1:144-647(-)